MAEDIEEIEVGAPAVGSQIKKPPSAWKVGLVGLLGGGPLVGLGLGIAQHFRNKNYLEHAAEQQQINRHARDDLQGLIRRETAIADDDEKRLLDYANGRVAEGYERIASGDSSGYAMIQEAQSTIKDIMVKDRDARKDELKAQSDQQRELVSTAAKGLRNEYQATTDAFNAINHTSQKVLALVADKNFDPNKPTNKAMLGELLSMGAMMFKDTPDMIEGLAEGVSALNGQVGGIVGGIATIMKSEDFKMSPEDYNRLALNAQKYAKVYATQKLEQLGSQAGSMDTIAKRLGVIPQDYSLGNYISGGEKELRMTPNPVFTGGYEDDDYAPSKPEQGERTSAPTKKLKYAPGPLGMQSDYWWDPINWGKKPQRPTN